MRRRSFLKAMVAAAAGCLAPAPKVVLSTRAGTLKPAWTEEQQQAWGEIAGTLEPCPEQGFRTSVELGCECIEPGCKPRPYSIVRGNRTIGGFVCEHRPFIG